MKSGNKIMTYVVSGILIFANFISTIIKGRGKLLSCMLLFFTWILFWGSYDNADYLNYKNLYEYVSYSGVGYATSQSGIVMIIRFISRLGLEYHHFLMVLSFIGIYLITETVKKYTDKPQLVYTLYFIHPFLLDVVQVKHFFTMAIITYCFRYLEQEGAKNNIKFIIGVLIASSIHMIAILFLPLLVIKKMKVKMLALFVTIVLVVGIPLAYTNIFEVIAAKLVGLQRIESYFLNRARFGFLIQFLIQGIILSMIHYSRKILERRKESNKFIELIYRTNLYLIILFPLYIINGTFERGFRMIMILNYIVISKLFTTSRKREKVMMLFMIFLFVFSLFLYYIFIPYRETVFFPILENNLLF